MVLSKIRNWFNKSVNLSKLLESKVVLYFLLFVVIINMYTYATEQAEVYAGVMILVGFLTSFFNKNMIVILFTAIAVTNLIRFGNMQQNVEGFTEDANLDKLTDHLTESKEEPISEEEMDENIKDMEKIQKEMQEKQKGVTDSDLNTDPSKRDKKIDEMVKSVGSAKIINALDKTTDMKNLELSRDKLELALKYVDRIVNEKQQKEVKDLFNVQLKLINQLIGMSPLINEFKSVLHAFDNK
jgi:low affinity Fe/Cu permease